MSLGGSRACSLENFFFNIVQFGAFWGVFCNMMIMAYSFENILPENANFMINNVNNSVFATDGIMLFYQSFGECSCIFTFWYNSEVGYIWFHKMSMKYGDMMLRDFFRETNLLRVCAHFVKNFAKHALSELILLK